MSLIWTQLCLQIWVQCPNNASGYFSIYGEESEYGEHFNARLVTGSTGEVYARTGYLGFLRRTEAVPNQGVPGLTSESTDLSDLSALAITAPVPSDTSGQHSSSCFCVMVCLENVKVISPHF